MIVEEFDHRYDAFFDETRPEVRWERLRAIYAEDYKSFRILFCVETFALIDKWREPTREELL